MWFFVGSTNGKGWDSMANSYNGGLTREQFLFFEIKTVATLVCQGLPREEIHRQLLQENLFQFPTERMIRQIANVCFKRIDALPSSDLVKGLAYAPVVIAKQINLYAMMRYNRIVWDFMTTVIAEKYRTQAFDYSPKDLNLFFFRLQEQSETVAGWTDQTINKIKQVLNKTLVECDYLDTIRSDRLNLITIEPMLEDQIRACGDLAALPAFNCFY